MSQHADFDVLQKSLPADGSVRLTNQIPFHALPALHEAVRDQCPPPTQGIGRALIEIATTINRQRQEPAYTTPREEMIEDSIVQGNDVVTMTQFHEMGPEGLAALVPEGAKTYVSIDVDVLDISLVPGCVSAEPNGMTYAELRDTLDAIARRTEIIAFDFVEVNPQLDVGTGVTAYLGAGTLRGRRFCDSQTGTRSGRLLW